MTELLDLLMVIGGFAYLVLGGDLLVRGSLGLAARTSVSPTIIGLTVVAMGSSAPELMVSVNAALNNVTGVAIGNVVGSNIANILLVLGAPVIIHPMVTHDLQLRRQSLIMLAVSALFVLICFQGSLGFLVGIVFLTILGAIGLFTFRTQQTQPTEDPDALEAEMERGLGLPRSTITIGLFIALGAITLPLGADMTVGGAAGLASNMGISDAVIGSTLVALGTSLPELSTTLIAALHKSSDIALGNVIGSNILNILAIMGITVLVTDIAVPAQFLAFDLWVMLGSALLLTLCILRQRAIGKLIGGAMLVGYVGYIFLVLGHT